MQGVGGASGPGPTLLQSVIPLMVYPPLLMPLPHLEPNPRLIIVGPVPYYSMGPTTILRGYAPTSVTSAPASAYGSGRSGTAGLSEYSISTVHREQL